MIKRIRSVLKYVLAGDALDKKKYRRASELMKESKYLAGPAYSRASLFEFNLRAALAAKLNGDPNAALQEVGAAKKKIKLLNSPILSGKLIN